MTIKKNKIEIYKILLVSLLFDAYAIVYIQTYPVTFFTIISVIFLLRIMVKNKICHFSINNKNVPMLILLVYVLINFALYGLQNFSSFFQTCFFILLFLFSYRIETNEKFNDYCRFYQKLMTIASIYGLYQFVGRIIGLPLTDLIIDGHMVTGYNWTNNVYFAGTLFERSNAFFREPSYFAQLLAVSLLLYIPQIFEKNKFTKREIACIALQTTCLILTFSGTGILLIIVTAFIYFTINLKSKKMIKKIFIVFIITLLVCVYVLLFTTLGEYILSRSSELFVYNRDASSGYVRFRAWIFIVQDAWQKNFLFGSGIGTGADYLKIYSDKFYAITLSGIGKVATELGLIGLVLWIKSMINLIDYKMNMKYEILSIAILVMCFMHETFASNIYWVFMMLLNCKIVNRKGEELVICKQK